MRHHRTGRKLGRDSAHRKAMLMNLAAELIEHGRIKTTLPKAKELRPYVERLVTRARTGDLHSRRIVMRQLRLNDRASKRRMSTVDERIPTVVDKLMYEVAPRFRDRPGGYTRILKLGTRPGDAAEMAYIEWVDYVPPASMGTGDVAAATSAPAAKAAAGV